jgi:hypothetical protein
LWTGIVTQEENTSSLFSVEVRGFGNIFYSSDIEGKEGPGMQVEEVNKGHLLEPMERKGQKAVLNQDYAGLSPYSLHLKVRFPPLFHKSPMKLEAIYSSETSAPTQNTAW